MTAADIAKQTAYFARQLIAAVKAESTEDTVILGHVRSVLGDLGVALGVIVERVATKQAASDEITGNFAIDLDERLNKDQLDGLSCIYCSVFLEGKSMSRVGSLNGCAVWMCFPVCPIRVEDVPDELVEVVLQQRGLAGLFADIGKIRAELAEILTKAKALGAR